MIFIIIFLANDLLIPECIRCISRCHRSGKDLGVEYR
jgi:hypothetical protein